MSALSLVDAPSRVSLAHSSFPFLTRRQSHLKESFTKHKIEISTTKIWDHERVYEKKVRSIPFAFPLTFRR